MSWTILGILVLIAVIGIGILLKLVLRQKLNSIDGFLGAVKEEDASVIGCFGDRNQK